MGEPHLVTLVPRIREAREAKGLTQEQLAAQLGVTRKSIWNFEQGRTFPNLVVFAMMALILGVSWIALYTEQRKGG